MPERPPIGTLTVHGMAPPPDRHRRRDRRLHLRDRPAARRRHRARDRQATAQPGRHHDPGGDRVPSTPCCDLHQRAARDRPHRPPPPGRCGAVHVRRPRQRPYRVHPPLRRGGEVFDELELTYQQIDVTLGRPPDRGLGLLEYARKRSYGRRPVTGHAHRGDTSRPHPADVWQPHRRLRRTAAPGRAMV